MATDLALNALTAAEKQARLKRGRMKPKVALGVGPGEAEKGLVVAKNLPNGGQVQVKKEAVLQSVKGILKNA